MFLFIKEAIVMGLESIKACYVHRPRQIEAANQKTRR